MSMAGKALPRPRLKAILLPAEHGGWGLMGAPVLLGLLVAPSAAGASIALAALGLFLSRQPLRLAASDLLKNKRFPRTTWAAGFAALYLALAALALGTALLLTQSSLWLPLAAIAVLACIQFSHDVSGKGRSLLPELAGALAASSFAVAIAMAGGAPPRLAWLATGILALHAVLAISYVSTRLDLSRGKEVSEWPVWTVAVLSVSAAMVAFRLNSASWLLPAGFGMLAARALWGISSYRLKVAPKVVGFQELGYTVGLIVLSALALGA